MDANGTHANAEDPHTKQYKSRLPSSKDRLEDLNNTDDDVNVYGVW